MELVLILAELLGAHVKSDIKQCYNAGNMNVIVDGPKRVLFGGIAAYASTSLITNCYNLGNLNVSGTAEGDDNKVGACVGGILGIDDALQDNAVSKVYNIGNVNSAVTTDAQFNVCGGIAGLVKAPVIKDAVYLSSSAQIGLGWDLKDGGTACEGISSIDDVKNMPSVLDIMGEAFKKNNKNTNGYPILSWQNN